jgi:hypothetical protein
MGLPAIGFSFESKDCPVTAAVTRNVLLPHDFRGRHRDRATRKREPNVGLFARQIHVRQRLEARAVTRKIPKITLNVR